MAQRYGFFNSVNNDRVYDASDVANFLSKFFTNGVFNNSLAVSSNDNMTVSVAIGSANINGYAYENTEVLILDIDEADSTLSRIDSVICRFDLTNRQINVMILQGNYATTPSQPSITRTGTIYDLRLANISVPAGATRITADMITDTRFGSDCGNVVGAVQQIDTTDVFTQYETYFNNWFKTLEDELSENQAGNLQNQINNLNNLVNENDAKVGDLNDLNTTDKSSIVSSINWLTPTVLFNDENGVQQGNLSEPVSLYAKIKMYYKTGDNQFGSEEIYSNGLSSVYTSVFKGSAAGTNTIFYAKVGRVHFDDMTFTIDRSGNLDIKTASNNAFTENTNAIKILRVEGLEKIGV